MDPLTAIRRGIAHLGGEHRPSEEAIRERAGREWDESSALQVAFPVREIYADSQAAASGFSIDATKPSRASWMDKTGKAAEQPEAASGKALSSARAVTGPSAQGWIGQTPELAVPEVVRRERRRRELGID